MTISISISKGDNKIYLKISRDEQIGQADNIFERRLPTGLAVENFHAMATSQQVSDYKSQKNIQIVSFVNVFHILVLDHKSQKIQSDIL